MPDSGLDLGTLDPELVGVVMGTGLVPMDMGPMLANAVNENGRLAATEFGFGHSVQLIDR